MCLIMIIQNKDLKSQPVGSEHSWTWEHYARLREIGISHLPIVNSTGILHFFVSSCGCSCSGGSTSLIP